MSLGDRLSIVLAALIGGLAALLIGQTVLCQTADSHLRGYVSDLLTHAVDVAQTSREALSAINASPDTPCADSDLEELRHLSFQSEYLRDAGRIQDNSILCTALWGELSPPAALPPVQRMQHEGDMLWANVEHIGPQRIAVDMAGRGSAIVFTSPIAFKSFETLDDNLSALVLTSDGQHIYRAFGQTAGLAAVRRDTAWSDFGSSRTASLCSADVDICVTARIVDVGMERQSPQIIAATGLLGLITGGSMGLAAILYRNSRMSPQQQIRRALAGDRIGVAYQPLVQMRDRRVVGVEALARPVNERGEAISPEWFITTAEEHGLIGQVTQVLVRKILADMRSRLQADPSFYVSINISAADMLTPEMSRCLDAEIARNGLSPRQIVLEITERSTADYQRLVEAMSALRARGHRIFLDDFGTGYSNLAYLAKLPIDGIKVDRLFTQAIGREAVSSAIVADVCRIAETIRVTLVAEGVETEEQATRILALHPEAIGQGWLYGKPVSAAKLAV